MVELKTLMTEFDIFLTEFFNPHISVDKKNFIDSTVFCPHAISITIIQNLNYDGIILNKIKWKI